MAETDTIANQLSLSFSVISVAKPLKSERTLMELPFFSLSKSKCMTPLIYRSDNQVITVKPGSDGMPTIWDQDILLYISSLLNEQIERGHEVSKVIRFKAYDLLTFCGRSTAKRGYELLWQALNRLQGTQISTNIQSNDKVFSGQFSWIPEWKRLTTLKNGKTRVSAVEVTLSDWLFDAITKERRILSLPRRDYFKLTGGLQRKVYLVARKHVGRQSSWKISLPKLADKCGCIDRLSKFRERLALIAKDNPIPGYGIIINLRQAKGKNVRNADVLVQFYNLDHDQSSLVLGGNS